MRTKLITISPLVLASSVYSQTTVTLNPVSDAYVNDSMPDGIFDNTSLVVGRSPTGSKPRYRSFLRFDLSAIPIDATLSSAVLRLNLQTLEGTAGAPIELRRVVANWSGTTLTWNNQPAVTTPLITVTVGSSTGVDYVWPIPSLAQGWINGQYANQGISLWIMNESSAALTRTFASADHSIATSRPRLTITYSVPPDIDVSPTTLGFGNQPMGGLSTAQSILVQNKGMSALTISNIATSSAEFPITFSGGFPVSLSANGSLTFQARFAPTSAGARTGILSILSDDPDEPRVEVSCSGMGIGPRVSVLPLSLNFGTVTLGTTARSFLNLQNVGNTDLVITAVTSTIPLFQVEQISGLPLTLGPGQTRTLSVDYTPQTVDSVAGEIHVQSNDPFTPGIIVPAGGAGAPPVGTGCGQAPEADVVPLILSPADGSTHLFGEPITFLADNDPNALVQCHTDCYNLCWSFRREGAPSWEEYQFTPGRVLGCDQLLPLPGTYEVKVRMCGVESAVHRFEVVFDEPILDEHHPWVANPEDRNYICYIPWFNPPPDQPVTTAHFNVFWNDRIFSDVDEDGNDCNDPLPQTLVTRPTTNTLGLLECVWATLTRQMTSPLSDAALFRNDEGFAALSHLPYWVAGPSGGGKGYPMAFGMGQGARTDNWVPVHELFHTFDYAVNPLHNIRVFDRRTQGNPYVFFHEAPVVVIQGMARDAFPLWGYRTDVWPSWMPLDVGLIELGYDGSVFWNFVMNTYPLGPRLTWEGPSICACERNSQPHKAPPNFELFEEWYQRVQAQIRSELGPDVALNTYACTDNLPPTAHKFFIYNGHVDPRCSQTLEYELAVVEGIVREHFPSAGTPLQESLLLDFAVSFASNFPPWSLIANLPRVASCADLAGINFANGFANQDRPDNPICVDSPNFNTNDFYARIQFRILDPSVQYLRLTANDQATLYVDGRAIIEPLGDPFPSASTTYADQRWDDSAGLSYDWDTTTLPMSSIVSVDNVTERRFEIEWVNRGDGKGNMDATSRYYLALEACSSSDPATATCTPIPADQIEVSSNHIWPNQGSGRYGFLTSPVPKSFTNVMASKEIQLRTVSPGDRPFFLPPLGVHYHPIECPAGYCGPLDVTVHHDGLTLTRPSAHLLVLTSTGIEWRGPLDQIDQDNQRVFLEAPEGGGPATFEGDPAIILVVARRTYHDVWEGPGRYGTLGALHYTVHVPIPPPFSAQIDRYDDGSLGLPPNNSLIDATPLENEDGGDVLTGPGRGPDRLWSMLVTDLSLHNGEDVDYFLLNLPDDAGDDCLDDLPNCDHGNRLGNGLLEITVRSGGATEIIAYDAQGNELAHDDHYLRVGCPRESGLDPFTFAVHSPHGCGTDYSLEILYSVPNEALWKRMGDRCIPPGGGGGGFDIDDWFRLIDPEKMAGSDFIYGLDCDPVICDPPKHDYLIFHWAESLPFHFEFQHAGSIDFEFALLDAQFNFIAGSSRMTSSGTASGIGGTGGTGSDFRDRVTQQLLVSYLPEDYYVLRVSASQFGVPYTMRALGLPDTELRIHSADVVLADGTIRFRWTAEPGRHYLVQFKQNLGDPTWTDTGTAVRATSSVATFVEARSSQTRRFYRVVRLDL